MAIGVVVGTYSSTFIAAPTLLFLETYFGEGGDGDKKPRSRESEPGGRSGEKKAGGRKARSRRSRAARA
jgi:hypothetical protein